MIDYHNQMIGAYLRQELQKEDLLVMGRRAKSLGFSRIYSAYRLTYPVNIKQLRIVRDAVVDINRLYASIGLAVHVKPSYMIPYHGHLIDHLLTYPGFLEEVSELVLELPAFGLPIDLSLTINRLEEAGFRVVLSSPERHQGLMRHWEVLRILKVQGVAFQLELGSYFGKYGKRVQEHAKRMLDEGLIDRVGTNAAEPEDYRLLSREALDDVCKRVGKERWKAFSRAVHA